MEKHKLALNDRLQVTAFEELYSPRRLVVAKVLDHQLAVLDQEDVRI